MQKIKVKYVPSEHKAVFMYINFARTILKVVTWKPH